MAKVVFALMPEFVQVFVKFGGLFGQCVVRLEPDFVQVFVKVGGLFSQGCFCLDA